MQLDIVSSMQLEIVKQNYSGNEGATKLKYEVAITLDQVRLFVELFASEVQPAGFKVLRGDSQESFAEGKEAYTKGLVVRQSNTSEF